MLVRLLPLLLLVPVARAEAPPNAAALDQIAPAMQKYMAADDISGAVTVVGRADGFTHVTAVGLRDLESKKPMEKDTLFRIASMTKPITAIGIMILADEGKLSPDDDVAKVPARVQGPDARRRAGQGRRVTLKKPARPIKLRDLLTHTGGIAPYPPGVDDVYAKRNRTLAETTLAVALQPLRVRAGQQVGVLELRHRHPRPGDRGRLRRVATRSSCRSASSTRSA